MLLWDEYCPEILNGGSSVAHEIVHLNSSVVPFHLPQALAQLARGSETTFNQETQLWPDSYASVQTPVLSPSASFNWITPPAAQL